MFKLCVSKISTLYSWKKTKNKETKRREKNFKQMKTSSRLMDGNMIELI